RDSRAGREKRRSFDRARARRESERHVRSPRSLRAPCRAATRPGRGGVPWRGARRRYAPGCRRAVAACRAHPRSWSETLRYLHSSIAPPARRRTGRTRAREARLLRHGSGDRRWSWLRAPAAVRWRRRCARATKWHRALQLRRGRAAEGRSPRRDSRERRRAACRVDRARARHRRQRRAASSRHYDRSTDARAANAARPCWIQWQHRRRRPHRARRSRLPVDHAAWAPRKFVSRASLAAPLTVPYVLAGLTDPSSPSTLWASRLDGAVTFFRSEEHTSE